MKKAIGRRRPRGNAKRVQELAFADACTCAGVRRRRRRRSGSPSASARRPRRWRSASARSARRPSASAAPLPPSDTLCAACKAAALCWAVGSSPATRRPCHRMCILSTNLSSVKSPGKRVSCAPLLDAQHGRARGAGRARRRRRRRARRSSGSSASATRVRPLWSPLPVCCSCRLRALLTEI